VRSGPHSYGGIERYPDEFPKGAFRMQRPVDSVACNEDTVLCLRSSLSFAVPVSSGLPKLIRGGGLQLIYSFKAKGRFLSRVGSGEPSSLVSRMTDGSRRSSCH